ncbi:hypothetical protein [Gracilimonas halophila]|uniref:Uncharacterized protein n=1 Tax=Gracilimonas halophila TaxID=1834464 RepID=A0ABW5JL21_9BACT
MKNKLEKLEKGMLDDAEAEELRKHLRTHVQGHICDPLDPNCGGSG